MSTANKLTYLNTTKGKIKDAINLTGANILSEDTFRSYADKLKQGLVDAINDGGSTIYSNFPKTTGTGTEIALNDTYEAPMRTTLKGNTHQDSYTGKNLFDKTTITENQRLDPSGNNNYDENCDLSDYIKIQPNTTYTRNMTVSVYECICFYTINKTFISRDTTHATTTSPNNAYYVRISCYKTNLDTLQLEQGSSATSYEPYCGGIPSPNPDYPQDVKVVTGDNTINIHGKNLFDISKIERNNYYSYGTQGVVPTVATSDKRMSLSPTNAIIVKPNTQYTLTFPNGYRYAMAEMSDGYISLGDSGWKTNTTYTFTTSNTTKYIGFNFSKTDNSTISDNDWNTFTSSQIQIEQGSTATTYEEYQSQTYPINLGSIELCKIGDYQDYIYKENNKWYKHSEIGKVVLDGTLTQYTYSNNCYQTNIKYPSNIGNREVGAYCDYFKFAYYPSSLTSNIKNGEIAWNGSFYLTIKNTDFTSAAEYNNWFAQTKPTIYYPLETPTNTEITDTTLINQLDSIKSLDNQTNISSTYPENNSQMIITASALKKN